MKTTPQRMAQETRHGRLGRYELGLGVNAMKRVNLFFVSVLAVLAYLQRPWWSSAFDVETRRVSIESVLIHSP